MISHDPLWFLPLLLYAETHYRFRHFFSFLRKTEPEIIADAPHRIEPGQKIPLLLLAKDAHHFPCRLLELTATIAQEGTKQQSIFLLKKPVELRDHWWWRLFLLDPPTTPGWTEIDVVFKISVDKKISAYRNDNYRTSSHRSLRVYVSSEPLPRIDGLQYGDCHTHSTYTEDQVEYGSPLGASIQLSAAMGLSFVCVTDHSYDLDDVQDNYLLNDPSVLKWEKLAEEIETVNRSAFGCVVVRGEEISARNDGSHNVHFLVLGNEAFFPGSGDGAERWLRTRSEYSVRDITRSSGHGIGFAAHPQENVPLLQRVLLGRGRWEWNDILAPGLHGIQFLNGHFDNGFQRGRSIWIKGLLLGMRLYAIAGNDAHGNFNRFRQIGIPFLRIREKTEQLFGKMRTGIYVKGKPTPSKVLEMIERGRVLITDGPAASLTLRGAEGHILGQIGDECTGSTGIAEMRAASSTEYGLLESIRLYCGTIGGTEEVIFEARPNALNWSDSLRFQVLRPIYIRLEATTDCSGSKDDSPHYCFTNPIWLFPPLLKQKSPSFKGLLRKYNSPIADVRSRSRVV